MPCNCQQSGTQSPKPKARPSNAPAAQKPSFISVRYTGPTTATARGGVSGRQYTFSRTGMTLQVDPRDKAGLMKVPHLRQI
jgi:hypothetical protein